MTQFSNIFEQEQLTNIESRVSQTSSLVIIDSSVDNLEILKAGLKPGAEVVVLHPQLNGIEQITTLVSRRTNIQKVHLISHGSSGSLQLGASELNIDNVNDYSAQLKTWFGDRGDRVSLFVYGCQVASGVKGQNFVQKLHQLTGSNIVAATQTIGSSDRGGVWDLDYAVGTAKYEIIFNDEVIQNYSGTFMDELSGENPILEELTSTEEPVAETSSVEEPTADASIEETEDVEDIPTQESVEDVPTEDVPTEDVPAEEPVADAPIEETEDVEDIPTQESVEDVPTEDVPAEEPVSEDIPVVGEDSTGEAPTDDITFNDVINLTAINEGESVSTEFAVDRDAGYNNTVDFYEVSADGSVVDLDGTSVAIGEEGYEKAAVANRVGLDLKGENGTTSEFSGELEGGKLYAPVVAVDSDFETFADDNTDNDPTVYFADPDANSDGLEHIRNSEPGAFEFEDLPDGGDADFNDIAVKVSSDNPSISFDNLGSKASEDVVDGDVSTEDVPTEDVVDGDVPTEDLPTEDVVDGDVPTEDLPTEDVVDGDVPTEYVPTEDAVEGAATLANFEGAEIQVQAFSPDLESAISEPVTVVAGNGVELSSEAVQSADVAGDDAFLSNFDIDIAGGVAGEGSIRFDVNDNQSEGSLLPGEFTGAVFTDISGELPPIEDVTLNESATTLGLDSSDVTFTEDTISVNFESLDVESGLTALVDVDFAGV